MRPPKKIPFPVKKLALAAALATLSAQAGAGPILDGKFDEIGVGLYTLGFTIGFIDDKGHAIGDGKLYFGISDDVKQTQFLYFQMPFDYVDNTYGDKDDELPGGQDSSWQKEHKFNDLLGSDSLGTDSSKKGGMPFVFNGNEVRIDYIAQLLECVALNKDNKCTTLVKYESAGVTPDSGLVGVVGAQAYDRSEGNIFLGSAASIVDIATSLEYNLKYVDTSAGALSISPANLDWILEVGYEIQFAKDTFNAADWLDPSKAPWLFSLGSPHVSPSKEEFAEYGEPVCTDGCGTVTPQGVPEPGTILLVGAGLLATAWAARRRRQDWPPGEKNGLSPPGCGPPGA